jgi:hypothetical protein
MARAGRTGRHDHKENEIKANRTASEVIAPTAMPVIVAAHGWRENQAKRTIRSAAR